MFIGKISSYCKKESKNKKQSEHIQKYIEEIKLVSENPGEYKADKTKKFYSYVKLDNKTRFFNTVLHDNLSPTMHAFYYCEKIPGILSDKDAMSMKKSATDNNFEVEDQSVEPVKTTRNNVEQVNISLS